VSLFSRWLRRTGPCRCGHDTTAHAHYRDGGQCCSCPQDACTQYRPVSVWGRLVASLNHAEGRFAWTGVSDGHGDRALIAESERRMHAELNRIHPGYAQPTDTIPDRSSTNWARVADLYREEH